MFATARNVEQSVHLLKVAQEAPGKNIMLLQADVVDHHSLEVPTTATECGCSASTHAQIARSVQRSRLHE